MRTRVGVALASACMLWTAGPALGAAEPTKEDKAFTVKVGPNRDQECKVVGYLYTPPGVDKDHPAPAILATNGFGGSRDDFDELGPAYAKRGYVFLAYSGLGFGGSGCKITLDDREHDGAAGSQLIDFLGGLDTVVKDGPGDPRVGMIGGSYGGQIQFAVAGVDKRLDTIIPQITWNDLSYSLSPNNTDFTKGVTYGTPGVVKLDWPTLFFSVGQADGVQALLTGDSSHLGPCPNFADDACAALVNGASRGYLDDAGIKLTRNASVSSYMQDIRIPTFLTQGQSDNLFDLQEAVANYQALKAQGVPVKMLWRSSGHSGGGIGKSESDSTDLEGSYESRADLAWFDHYLKGDGPAPALDFSFLTDWIPFDEGKDAAAAVGVAPSYPAAPGEPLYLSGADALTADKGAVKEGAAQMAEAAAPTSQGGGAIALQDGSDQEGTSVSYTTAPLADDLDLAGIPSVTFRVDAPTFASAADPAQKLLLFAKLYDVAPDGSATLNRALISAARVGDPTKPVTIELPGLVHRYAKGHALRLTIATSSATHRGGMGAGPVTIETSPQDPGVLTIPKLGAQTGPVGSGPNGSTPFGTAPGTNPPGRLRRAAKLPKRRPCRTTPRRISFRLRAKRTLAIARVAVNGKRVETLRGKQLRKRVTIRLKRRVRAHVVVTSLTRAGETRRNGRRYRACGPR